MGLLTGRAGRAVVAAGTGIGTMKLGGQWTDARRTMGRLLRCGPRRPPESSPHSPGGSSSASNHRASRLSAGAALSRAGSVACYATGVVLVAVAGLLALPLQAEAQKTTFVSNTGQSTDPDVREVGPDFHLWRLQAQKFRTGDNEGGYTLSAIKVRVDDFESASSPKVSIYTVTSGDPGTSLYLLTNPATLNNNAINTFRAPANATLEKDTDYFVMFEEAGSGSDVGYDLEVTTSNAEDSGKASGWSIANSSRQRSTNITTWSDLAGKLKIAVLGSSAPTLSIADASAAENAGHLLFEVTLSRALQNTVKVDFETISGGTATEGVDYWAHDYTHVILAGDKTAQMGFALIEDTVDDAGETVEVRLSNARLVDAYGDKIKDLDITTAEATGTITAPPPFTTTVPGLTIRIQDATGDEDNGWLVFKVKLSRKYDDYVCYDFETISGGTATEGTDYVKHEGSHWIQIGKKVDKPFLRIIDDSVNDNGETVKVKISNARLCGDASQTLSITRAEATGTIRNSDPLPRALMARFGRTAAVHWWSNGSRSSASRASVASSWAGTWRSCDPAGCATRRSVSSASSLPRPVQTVPIRCPELRLRRERRPGSRRSAAAPRRPGTCWDSGAVTRWPARGRIRPGAAGGRAVAVAQPEPGQLRGRRRWPDGVLGDGPLPLGGLQGDGPHHALGCDRLRAGLAESGADDRIGADDDGARS